jgi:3-dehydroquinate synthase
VSEVPITRIRVGAESSGYDVLVGEKLLHELPSQLGDGVVRVAVVHSPAVTALAVSVREILDRAGMRTVLAPVPDGEAAKQADVIVALWSLLGEHGFTRSDAVVAVGGGATTDSAGFAAATWLRGVRLVNVPTTLLGMVDAAVGGKTGIDTDQGKNLVGAFHPPVGVVCDLSVLATLPEPEFVSGMAEVAKAGFIADPEILRLLDDDLAGARTPKGPHTRELVERAIAVKAAVVSRDLREDGLREILNYGHTLGHAIERVEQYRWRHGDAIAVGMVFAAELSRLAGRLTPDVVARHRAVLGSLGLPLTYRADAWAELDRTMRLDKKSRGDVLRFVVLNGIANPGILAGPDSGLLEAAYAEVAA